MDFILEPVCPWCEKGYLSHRSYDERDNYQGITQHVERDFCSNPFCNYDYKTRSIVLN